MRKIMAVRLEQDSWEKMKQLQAATNWSQSEIIRMLIENAWVKPATLGAELTVRPKKEEALALS